MHTGPDLRVAHKDPVDGTRLGVVRQESGPRVVFTQNRCDLWITITPPDIPGMGGVGPPHTDPIVRHSEHFTQMIELSLEGEELALVFHTLVSADCFRIDLTEEVEAKRSERRPVMGRPANHNRLTRVGICGELLFGRVVEYEKAVHVSAHLAVGRRTRRLHHEVVVGHNTPTRHHVIPSFHIYCDY